MYLVHFTVGKSYVKDVKKMKAISFDVSMMKYFITKSFAQ